MKLKFTGRESGFRTHDTLLGYSRMQRPLYFAPILKEIKIGLDLPFLLMKASGLLLCFAIALSLNLSSIISTTQSTTHWAKPYHVQQS